MLDNFPPEPSTSAQLSMFDLVTWTDTASATSLPASEDGDSPSSLPDGITLDLFGQEVAPASPSPPPADKAEALTSGIFGLTGFGSSASVALTQLLANRLRERLASAGSIEFAQTWKRKITPSGRRYWAHTASARHISDKDFSGSQAGWPTPTRQDQGGSGVRDYPATPTHHSGTTLTDAARLAHWATPRVRDADKGVRTPQAARKEIARKGPQNELGLVVGLVPQPAAWATPRANKWGEPDSHGKTAFGSPASTEKRGASLNAAFSLWLQGYPPQWMAAAPSAESVRSEGRATPSSRKSPPSSSPP